MKRLAGLITPRSNPLAFCWPCAWRSPSWPSSPASRPWTMWIISPWRMTPTSPFYQGIKETFGEDEFFVIAFSSPDLFTPPFLRMIAAITRALETIPEVREVQSLANVDYIHGEEEFFEVRPFLERIPEGRRRAGRPEGAGAGQPAVCRQPRLRRRGNDRPGGFSQNTRRKRRELSQETHQAGRNNTVRPRRTRRPFSSGRLGP